MEVKVCGLTDLGQIQELESMGIDYAGLIFYEKSPRFHVLKPADLLAVNIKLIGVFVNEKIEIVMQKAKLFNLSFVQLHGEEGADYCRRLKDAGIQVIKVFSVNESFDFGNITPYENSVDYFLFDTKGAYRGGNGIQFDWSLLRNYKAKRPYFLSGGIGADSAAQILKLKDIRCAVIDINSRFEIKPGVKDLEKIKQFTNAISSR